MNNVCLLIVDDLHLEGRNESMVNEFADGIKSAVHLARIEGKTPILICAGDISEGTKGLEWVTQFDCDTIYVCGNHEFWHGDYYETINTMREKCSMPGYERIYFLENKTVVVHGIRFIGATLWTDMGQSWPWVKKNFIVNHFSSMADFKQITAREFYRNGEEVVNMVNFLRDNGIEEEDITNLIANEGFNPYIELKEHLKSVEYIEDRLIEPYDGETIVVTHHLPVAEMWKKKFNMKDNILSARTINTRSIYQEYLKKRVPPEKDVLMMGFYINHLDYMFDHNLAPNIWVHGHFHKEVDGYIGYTRITSSPVGYVRQSQKLAIKRIDLDKKIHDYASYALKAIEEYKWESILLNTLDEISKIISGIKDEVKDVEMGAALFLPIFETYRDKHQHNIDDLESFVSSLLYNLLKIEDSEISIADEIYITAYLSGFVKYASKHGSMLVPTLAFNITESSFLSETMFKRGKEKGRMEHYTEWLEEIENIKEHVFGFRETLANFFKNITESH